MSIDLKDFRGKITAETDVVLEAINRTTGKDRSEIAREVLHKWALERIDTHNVLADLMVREGLIGKGGGK